MAKKVTSSNKSVVTKKVSKKEAILLQEKIDRKRSLAAKKGAVTRARNQAQATSVRSLRLHHKIIAGFAVLAVLIVTFMGIRNQIVSYAATTSSAGITIVGLDGNCLDNNQSALKNHNQIQVWNCNSTVAQKWIIGSDGSIRNYGSNYCIDVPSASKKEYVYLQLYKCNGTVAQKFSLSGDTLVNTNTGFCATDHFNGTANGTRIWMKRCHGSEAQKWVEKSNGSVVTPTPIPTPTPTPTPPTPTASYDLNSIISGITSAKALSLNTGTYTVKDFSYFNNYGVFSKSITSINGTGSTTSIIQMAAKTSSKAKSVPTASSTTNPFYLVRIDGSPTLSNFGIKGTDQGHLYNGLLLYHTTNAKVSNIKLTGAGPGNNNYPPGETFSLNDFHGLNSTYNNVEIDGGGVGASAFGPNSTSGGTWTNSSAHDNPYSIGWAFWQQTNGATITDSKTYNNRGGVNFERATGTFNLVRMTFGGNTSADISGGSDQSSDMKVIITDPILLNGQTKLKVNWFTKEAGVANKYGKKNIQVIVNGVDKTSSMIQWIGVGAG